MDKLFEVPATRRKVSLHPYEDRLSFSLRLQPRREKVEALLEGVEEENKLRVLSDALSDLLFDEIQSELEQLHWAIDDTADFNQYAREILHEIEEPTWMETKPESSVIKYLVDIPK